MERKTAIIVGASSEIGLKIAEKLKEREYNIYGTYNKHKENLVSLLGGSYMFKIDLNSENSRQELEDMVKEVWRNENKINAGIYVAGVWRPFCRFISEDEKKIKEMWDVNYFGAYWFFRALVPYVIQTKDVGFVAIGSTAGVKGSPRAETYGITKAALINLMVSLSEELANHGVRANTISPGPVNTNTFRQYYPNEMDLKEVVKNIPLNRLAEPEDIAHTVLYLLENKYITRQNIVLDGASMF